MKKKKNSGITRYLSVLSILPTERTWKYIVRNVQQNTMPLFITFRFIMIIIIIFIIIIIDIIIIITS